jgi:integrase
LRARWSEVDLNKTRLVKPAATMKSKREHIVPLSSIALAVLERRDRVRVRTGDEKVDAAALVFAGESGRALNYTLFALAPKRAGVDAGAPHSWRSVFRDWAATIGRVDGDLAELALAHALDPTKRAYFRDTAPEPRRAIMEAFARCETRPTPLERASPFSPKIVSIRGSRCACRSPKTPRARRHLLASALSIGAGKARTRANRWRV